MKRMLTKKETWILMMAIIGILIFWKVLPHRLFNDPTSYVLEDNQGNLLGASIASDGQWRFPDNRVVPEKFATCITTFEDRRFYQHPGIDFRAIARAVVANVTEKKKKQGGSTITMQVIRLSANHTRRSWWNKITEAIMALRLEFSSSKSEILSVYAAHAPFGANIVGLDAAAWRYYGRSPSQLSWSESATLAVLPNSPALIHLGRNRNALLAKRNSLLDELYREQKITSSEWELAKAEPLPEKPLPLPQLAPQLLTRIRNANGNIRGIRIRSTIDHTLQRNVSSIVATHHQILKTSGINNLCALVVEVETGNALAYIGNVNDDDPTVQDQVDIINSPRSPGSALKPILYSAMMSSGLILPKSLVPDIPTSIAGYSPKNFDLNYDGAVPADQALARSLNIPAIRMLRAYKYQQFYGLLRQLGITTLTKPADFYGLSLVLGGCEVTPWDLAGAYASLARSLNHIRKNKGRMMAEDIHSPGYIHSQKPELGSNQVNLDATSIYFSFQAMQEVMRPGDEGLWQQFSSSQRIAWKTGTSFGFRDGWAVGVTPKYVVVVWAGNANGEGRPGLIGVQTAAPVMFDIFRLLHTVSWFKRPDFNYSRLPVCRATGFRAGTDCPIVDTLYAPPAGEQTPLCPYHKLIHLDAEGKFQVNSECYDVSKMQHQSRLVFPPTMEYYYLQRHADYEPLPPFKPGCNQSGSQRLLDIIYPESQARIYVPIEITGSLGRTIFKATHREKDATLYWSIDDEIIGETTQFHQLSVHPPPGPHILTITDQHGNSVSHRFEIISKE